jgi:hypothetical protein
MSNRKRLRDQATNKRSNKHRKSKGWFQRGIDGRHDYPLHDDSPMIDSVGMVRVDAPEMAKVEVIKEVPAMHTGLPGGEHENERVQVGVAIIHSTRTVSIKYDEDAPLWALEEIQAYADHIGYNLATGEPNGPA